MRLLLKGLPLAMALVLLLPGCEQTIDADLPYERLIVINTFVGTADDSLAWISRTLPATEEPTAENAAIMDADVKLFWRDTTYQLPPLLAPRGYQLPKPDARWGGDSLRIVVEWQRLRAEATARMPVEPTFIKAEFIPSANEPSYTSLSVTFRTRPGCVIWVEGSRRGPGTTPLSMYDFYRVIPGDPTDAEQEVTMRVMNYFRLTPGDTIDLVVSIADRVYAQYLDDPNAEVDGPFSFGGAGAFTNVKGNGLGMFVPVVSVPATVVID